MPTANAPEDIARLIGEAMTAKDMDAALSLYEPDATFALPKGFGEGSVTGLDALRETFNGFLAMSPVLTVNPEKTLLAGDTALVIGNWTLKGTGPDGKPLPGPKRMRKLANDHRHRVYFFGERTQKPHSGGGDRERVKDRDVKY